MAKNLQEVRVYRKALTAAGAVSVVLSRSSGRVAPLIAEGYGQLTDRHLATYLGRARGSVLETIGHLSKARGEEFITASDYSDLTETYDHIGKMLTRWIDYLRDSDWTDRG